MIFLNLIFRRIRKSKKTPVFKTLWNFMYPKWPNYFRKITINSIWESLDFLLVEIWVRLLKMTCDCVNHVMINYRGNVWLSILPPTSLPTTAGRFCLGSSFFFFKWQWMHTVFSFSWTVADAAFLCGIFYCKNYL